jgi:hypothetical protein
MNPTIAFTVTIPIKNSDAANLKEAFVTQYNYKPQVTDSLGNVLNVTEEMFIEDTIAYYIMNVTKDYLVKMASENAADTARTAAEQ